MHLFGLSLIDLCCQFDIHSLNGRTGDDQDGDFTYVSESGCSVIDYILTSTEVMLKSVNSFEISNLDVSKHLPLTCSFHIASRDYFVDKPEVLHDYVVYKWEDSCYERFIALLKDEVTQNMTTLFHHVIETSVEEAFVILKNILKERESL